jgi:hypothetical protein
MTNFPEWRDVRADIVADVGEEAIAEARRRNQAHIDAHRLAETAQGTGPDAARGRRADEPFARNGD